MNRRKRRQSTLLLCCSFLLTFLTFLAFLAFLALVTFFLFYFFILFFNFNFLNILLSVYLFFSTIAYTLPTLHYTAHLKCQLITNSSGMFLQLLGVYGKPAIQLPRRLSSNATFSGKKRLLFLDVVMHLLFRRWVKFAIYF